MIYTVKRIDEDLDFGCEERAKDAPVMAVVTLVDSSGEELRVKAEDALLYKNNINEDKKWRGKYRLNVPKDDGTKEDGWTKNTFNGAMYAFEDSNGGFHWDWDENKLKDLTVGALFRRKEWEYNGQTGWTTECCELIPAQDVRENNFQIPKDKPLKNKSTARSAMPAGFEEIVDDDDLPFKL